MGICSQIFAEKSNIIIKFCVRTDRGEGSQPNVGRYGQRGGESKIMALINTTIYRKPTNTNIHITVTQIHIPPKSWCACIFVYLI